MSEITTNKKTKDRFKYFGDFHKAAFRILLIDDKVGSKEYGCKGIPIKKTGESCDKELPFCRDCTKTIDEKKECSKEYFDISEIGEAGLQIIQCDNNNNCRNKQCKLCTIKRLMDDSEKNDGKREVFTGIGETIDYYYWQESGIECYYCPTVIKDFVDDCEDLSFFSWDDKDGNAHPKIINVYPLPKDGTAQEKTEKEKKLQIDNAINIKCDFAPKIIRKNTKVQIIGVRDVRTALLLLSKFKFDMVFCDYLLDYKDDSNGERDYAKQLFDFLSYNYKDTIKNENDPSKKKRLEVLEQLRYDVLDNRGPLDKLWIMPITGFNQTFIQDLYRNKINLIDYKWNISNGADPITTPWQFLYHLNKFVELQLESCVYTKEQLMTFLLYTYEDLEVLVNGMSQNYFFENFQQFMGAEYANFMKRYGARKLIERDAAMNDNNNNENKSVFATYISDSFYNNPKYSTETELNRLMQNFYHQAATMFDDRGGYKLLRETFELMSLFINQHQLKNSLLDHKQVEKLEYGLLFLHTVIDSECNLDKINQWIKNNQSQQQ